MLFLLLALALNLKDIDLKNRHDKPCLKDYPKKICYLSSTYLVQITLKLKTTSKQDSIQVN